MEGESYTCMWGESAIDRDEARSMEVVKNATIQMTNLKSDYRPFIIFEPGVIIDPWVNDQFTFWNHWPVAQHPNDGRDAPAADRPSHTSFSCGAPVIHEGEGNAHIAVMLYGLTEEPIDELVPLARSWNHPPELKVLKGNVQSKGYDKFQRAWVLECEDGGTRIEIQLPGTKEMPVVNPAFVLKGWGEKAISISISGKEAKEGMDYRVGYENKLEGTDLVVWFKGESNEPKLYTFEPDD
jgi:hypothetical protein